jgi:hypothetical protein
LDKETAHKLFEQVKENHRILDSCTRHAFDIDKNPGQVFGKKWECSNCGGNVDSMAKLWYERGLQHGKE